MLRLLFVLLLAANAWWWAAGHGWLPSGWLPLPDDQAQREPQRLARQLRPQTVTVLPAGKRLAGAGSTDSAVAARICLQSVPLADAALEAAAQAALRAAGIAEQRWQRVDGEDGTRLRVDDASTAERDALGGVGSTDPAFGPCQ